MPYSSQPKDTREFLIYIMVNVNEELKRVIEEIKPLKLKKEESQELVQLEMRASFLKIIKSLFMEEVTKNKKMVNEMLKSGILSSHPEEVDGKIVEVIDQSMDEKIERIPEIYQQAIFEKLVKSHKENLAILKASDDLIKEQMELEILQGWLPKEIGKDEIMVKLKELYPEGISAKEMGPTIGKLKSMFGRVDGRVLADCVKSVIK